ncbi:RING/U-box superfamily protein [Abeliophyllum distichum]|uniref:RING/U-box superfamily protein n=1 Tax=Abeliophyllum distichum TaxID=126358 RepID=A0ABD1VUI6_9LAMI
MLTDFDLSICSDAIPAVESPNFSSDPPSSPTADYNSRALSPFSCISNRLFRSKKIQTLSGNQLFVAEPLFRSKKIQTLSDNRLFVAEPVSARSCSFVGTHGCVALEVASDKRARAMDDSCAVCAEVLEWVAYGECGHKDVCSTCVARLRFICDDRRCCICKTESNVVFVTKALGGYTNTISDFSVFPLEVKEGRVGEYWYHEDTQAFFDDSDHYKMIKAMCRLSCSVCDSMEGQTEDGSRRKPKFRNIEQLKGHLFHKHRLIMCSLCLEGRKVFICEQKLYTRAQLSQHIKTGDSEVDGTESERGGFMGHPVCEFCRTPFYGDNELYTHMSTEHYTCHICQRQHPGQFEYYKNYDDLEVHFRRDHFLCEDEACLAKKFIVFQFEPELKKHNALEHGGRMSRSQRSAALQIPISLRYRRSNEQDNRRGRGRMFHRDTSDSELSMAIQASLHVAPSHSNAVTDHGDISDVESFIPPFESLATTDAEPTSRYLQAVSQSARNSTLKESLFPPLSMAPGGGQQGFAY